MSGAMIRPFKIVEIDLVQALVSGLAGAVIAILIFKLGDKRLRDPLKWIVLGIVIVIAIWLVAPFVTDLFS
ncbi:MAG: hypothetical protein IH995_06360 [Proteobacteria bacterium]|nr:hypothetical protein [Pseudomonadota bacterium]